ncbi:MAG: hypothetical protein D4Q77_02070 [Methanothrix sp.]|nr:MAG: hypothetical protein D4Q77_02070 [Methanothrix sp.]
MKWKTKYLLCIILGALLVLAGLVYPVVEIDGETFSIPLVTMGLVVIALIAIRYWRLGGEIESDERTKKIGGYSIAYSWFLTLFLALFLFWVDYLHLLTLSVQDVLGATILVMTISSMIFKWYLFRKGDVE